MTPIVEDRMAKIADLVLAEGSHESFARGACVMEAVAYIAGEEFSDHPLCACPVISVFMRSWNDVLSEEDRNRLLKPLIPRLVDSKATPEIENRRSIMATDWMIRYSTPAWLRLAGLNAQADALSSLPEITDLAQVPSIMGPLEASRRDADAAWAAAWDAAWAAAWDAARAAARAAAWDAARAAAWDAARDAARAAAWDAARDAARAAARAAARDAAWAAARDAAWAAARDAAWAAARDAAWAAARDAAWDAAWAAARAAAWDAARAAARDAARAAARDAARAAASKKLQPTVVELQTSALALIDRMLELRG